MRFQNYAKTEQNLKNYWKIRQNLKNYGSMEKDLQNDIKLERKCEIYKTSVIILKGIKFIELRKNCT